MSSILNRLFRKKVVPPFDVEKAVGHYLLTLPRCTRRILVVSRRFLDKRYNYEMTVDSASLAAWAKMYETSSSSSQVTNATCKALLLWLRGADLTDNTVSFPPKEFFNEWRGYHSTFYEMPSTQVYCHECHRIVDAISMKDSELPPREIFDYMRYEWHCPQGHLLYEEEIGRHAVPRDRYRALIKDVDPLEIPEFLRKNI